MLAFSNTERNRYGARVDGFERALYAARDMLRDSVRLGSERDRIVGGSVLERDQRDELFGILQRLDTFIGYYEE